ncbi:uncharacterized protein LOC114715022 [Neltuma alba]|uniref:uncharacterized protein LOC114715022 n=1 Tax=Neltuma alba TaxID=207710 RepID=UPI0010A32B52|nr:uncharacterized protein LOC114715022 [Prosopis alba]
MGGTLPSNIVINPKALHAITLRSGKKVGNVEDDEEDVLQNGGLEVQNDMGTAWLNTNAPKCYESESATSKDQPEQKLDKGRKNAAAFAKEDSTYKDAKQSATAKHIQNMKNSELNSSNCKSQNTEKEAGDSGKRFDLKDSPFPKSYLLGKKKNNEILEKEMMDLYSKLEINVPMLVLIKQMPSYAKFLKELCTHKRICRPNKRVQLGSNVSALFKPQLPIKCADPGSFTVPCQIGRLNFSSALLDLGAAINVMSHSVYNSLGITNIKTTSIILQLADRSARKPYGFLEDILANVKGLVIPADFYDLDMSNESCLEESLILGRPFLRTANTVISLKDFHYNGSW